MGDQTTFLLKNREPLSEWYFHSQSILFHSEPSEVTYSISKTLVENIFGKQSILNSSCIMQFITHFEIDWLSCKKLCNIICTVIIFSSHAQHNLRGKKRLRKKWTETHLLQGNSNWRWCEKMKPIQSSSFFSFSFFWQKNMLACQRALLSKIFWQKLFMASTMCLMFIMYLGT